MRWDAVRWSMRVARLLALVALLSRAAPAGARPSACVYPAGAWASHKLAEPAAALSRALALRVCGAGVQTLVSSAEVRAYIPHSAAMRSLAIQVAAATLNAAAFNASAADAAYTRSTRTSAVYAQSVAYLIALDAADCAAQDGQSPNNNNNNNNNNNEWADVLAGFNAGHPPSRGRSSGSGVREGNSNGNGSGSSSSNSSSSNNNNNDPDTMPDAAAADAPCACRNVHCAVAVMPAQVAAEILVKAEALEDTARDFLIWAIVMSVVALVLALAVLWLMYRLAWRTDVAAVLEWWWWQRGAQSPQLRADNNDAEDAAMSDTAGVFVYAPPTSSSSSSSSPLVLSAMYEAAGLHDTRMQPAQAGRVDAATRSKRQ